MPVSRVRFTFFFSGNDSGWSESIHSQNDASSTALSTQLSTYLNFRVACLNSEYNVIGVRVSDDTVRGDIVVDRPLLPMPGTINGKSLPGYNAALLRMRSGTRIFRNLFLRGLTAAHVDGRNLVTPSATVTGITALVNYLKTGGWAIAAKDPTIDSVLEASYNVGTGVHTTSADITGLAPKVNLEAYKVKRSVLKKRIWTVTTAPDLRNFQLYGWTLATDVSGKAYWKVAAPALNAITDVRSGAVTERKVGRPFDVPRGRVAPVR
jgi:hypothetical protein